MGTHDRAWEGFKIVILANQPLQAMKIEQAIAMASPGTEVQLSSFEKYDQAYEFCKSQKDIGFLLVHENCGETSFLSAFRELATLYDNFDAPAYGVVLYDGEPNSFSEKSVGKNPLLLDYLPTPSLLDENRTSDTLNTIWDLYIGAFEQTVIPKALQDSIISVAEEKVGIDGVHFTSRLLVNLLSDLNVSWMESAAIKWSLMLEAVRELTPAVLKSHGLLNHFIELCEHPIPTDCEGIFQLLSGKEPLAKKVRTLALYLETHRQNRTLEDQLQLISAASKPGAPKLVRHIAKNSDRILSFQLDAINIRALG